MELSPTRISFPQRCRRLFGAAINVPLGWLDMSLTRNYTLAPKTGTVEVRIGDYCIKAPADGTIEKVYKSDPDYCGELGRLARAVADRYPDAAMIDVGANVGDTAAVVWSRAKLPIICIEGDQRSFSFLTENIRQFPGVTASCLFLGDSDDSISAQIHKEGFNNTIVPVDGGSSRRLELRKLDTFLDGNALRSRIKLLKIDTEGFDLKILRGSTRLLGDVRPVLYFEYNRENMSAIGEDGLSSLASLKELGYRTVCFYEAYGRFILATTLDQTDLLQHLHEYADGYHSRVYYYDMCVFHEQDEELAQQFIARERAIRLERSGPKAS